MLIEIKKDIVESDILLLGDYLDKLDIEISKENLNKEKLANLIIGCSKKYRELRKEHKIINEEVRRK